jgi:hypothetical protein
VKLIKFNVKDKIDSILGEGGACDLVILGDHYMAKGRTRKKGQKMESTGKK